MARVLLPEVVDRQGWPALRWRPAGAVLAVASSVVGGGLGPRHWVVNASVPADWSGDDEVELVTAVAPDGQPGCGMLTAVDVRRAAWAGDDGVECLATVGLGSPTWAARPADADDAPPPRAGTVNLMVWVPERMSEAALVNAVATATEAKAQALAGLGVPGTGTASDAIVVACPAIGAPVAYGGPRSRWGAPLARAVHTAVHTGAVDDHARATAAGYHRSWSP